MSRPLDHRASGDALKRLDAYFRAHRGRHLAEYFDFIRIPSISASQEHRADVRRAADWVADRCRRSGLEHTEILDTGGHPVVYADWLHVPDRPTILVYGHFDVQPVDPVHLWDTPPFDPVVRDGCVVARGAADDKIMVVPLLVAEAWLQTLGHLPVNLKCFFEGQEEILSPDLPAFLPRHRDRFACDFVVSSDGAQWSADQPSITLGHRGLAGVEIRLRGPARDLAAGGHGGAVQNPIHALAGLLASMRGADGRILVAGFYDAVAVPDAGTRAGLLSVPFDEEAYLREVGTREPFGEPGWTTLERRWFRPTLEVNGIWGGYQGEGNKSVLPAEAGAKITCRLVPDQDPDEIAGALEAHVASHAPPGVTVTATRLRGRGRPYRLNPHHPAVHVARKVLADVFGREPVDIYSGGTLPVADLFLRHLGAYTLGMAFSAPDERAHSPNEFYRLRNFDRGLRAHAAMWAGLADLPLGQVP
jgi:acetylornithine deacetylase/succinyl-diaminopimelate desuccinylase-like protein